MRVAIGCDHAGFPLKQVLLEKLSESPYDIHDFGVYGLDPSDYPDITRVVAEAVARGEFTRGILICGTGIGTSIAANKVPGIRAALVHDLFTAKATRLHNDTNILAMGARVIGPGLAEEIVRVWLDTPFSEEERHVRRLAKISGMERHYSSAEHDDPSTGGS